ncbi:MULTISPECIES: 1-aminocyclopropane-1-carboxylate deaminase/D-cysteine desulfhydrase [unclassified Undibacterium]|uniref:1-aminocyclopropane-1-carboxylate deaminase/D-cysteine desulfhydrase n=1 Tax=unclassified Undibacterium TaxID=2630295 RepID=UPI002AC95904|nr:MULTISPECIES: pyridoxal-phosphate dependent enzyme [unclassified Undibacterium]MEB0138861.1 pyridoxal-phosphate dependent enzyme [Undibacterium sp. CCC2.1]MEB0172277.1 pyridoxal-phosphate dependent enzyme [Undibacterium sp. CCC1.1]MEB0176106.1 pyridoxal-phosphate dependent enzyme [Undibacterium sp. CCC3.4]MEB0215933.1 pyridoxal-phosphate dependent enzyme [Undibacterium sp. 5I2]WPX44753.1 pyridoxal-phosphate dependent enzyme [Undibacterium sp. CCC3.4]
MTLPFVSRQRMLFSAPAASPCQRIVSSLFPQLQLWIKRDDLLHPQVSGNKFRKLKFPLQALAGQPAHLVSMGGLWSNHIHALAHAAAAAGLASSALIRGQAGMHSAMLDDCRALGMQIHFVDRLGYRALRSEAEAWRRHVPADASAYHWLPEGGSSAAALHGVAELVAETQAQLGFLPEVVALACGSGATTAGVLAGLQGHSAVLAVAVLKNAHYLHAEMARLLLEAGYPAYPNYRLLTTFHHGGYAKTSAALLAFCQRFEAETGILIEPVYTGKMLYALHVLCHAGYFRRGTRLLAIHTGGLQGLRGFA